jgi:hypothetical protein
LSVGELAEYRTPRVSYPQTLEKGRRMCVCYIS